MSDCCQNRVVVRHLGPPGPGVPDGGLTGQVLAKASDDDQDTIWSSAGAGMGDVIGPVSSVNNRLVAFNGTTGKVIKDSGLAISDVFTTTAAANKVDKVTGKGLSANDFTDALKAKLDAATAENYRGVYASFLALTTALPSANPGDYAYVSTVGTDLEMYAWDSVNSVWAPINAALSFSGQDIADILFNPTDAAAYSQADCRIFTSADKTAVDGAASLAYVNSLALAAGVLTPAYAAFSYFDLTGVTLNIVSVSDGISNLIKAGPVTTLDPASIEFDSPAPGRLRYTGAATRLFVATYNMSMLGTASATYVTTLSKNGSPIPVSRSLVGYASTPATSPTSATTLVSLSTNDYLEIFVGNTTDTNDPNVKVLNLEISPA